MDSHDCTCLERVIQWIEAGEVYHLERAAKLAKLAHRQRDVIDHQAKAQAYGHMLIRLNSKITCDRPVPPPPERKPWYQRWWQHIIKERYMIRVLTLLTLVALTACLVSACTEEQDKEVCSVLPPTLEQPVVPTTNVSVDTPAAETPAEEAAE